MAVVLAGAVLSWGSGCSLLVDFTTGTAPRDGGGEDDRPDGPGAERADVPPTDGDGPRPDRGADGADGQRDRPGSDADGGPDVPDLPQDAPDLPDLPDGGPDCTINVPTYAMPLPLVPVSGSINTTDEERSPSVASDGSVYFQRSAASTKEPVSLMVSLADAMGRLQAPVPVPLPADPDANDRDPLISRNQLTLYFASSNRTGSSGDYQLYVGTRGTKGATFTVEVARDDALGDELGPATLGNDFLFARSGDLYRATGGFDGQATPLPPPINSSSTEARPALAPGNLVYFASDRPATPEVELGRFRIYVANLLCPTLPPVRIELPNEFAGDDHVDPYVDPVDGTLYLAIRGLVDFNLFRASPK